MIFHIFSIPFLPWVFHTPLFKVLRKKNEIHCTRVQPEYYSMHVSCTLQYRPRNVVVRFASLKETGNRRKTVNRSESVDWGKNGGYTSGKSSLSLVLR